MSTRSRLSVENQRGLIARKDGRTCLTKQNCQARTGAGNNLVSPEGKNIFPVQLTTSRIGEPYLVDSYSARRADQTYVLCEYWISGQIKLVFAEDQREI